MSDPERLCKSSADPAVRELVASLREVAPGQNAGLAAWSAMAAKVATLPKVVPPPAPASVSAGAASVGVMGVVGSKVAAVVAVAALLGVGGYCYRTAHAPLPISRVSSVPVAAPLVAVGAPVAPAETPPKPISAAPTNISAAPALSGTPRSRLDAEASLVATVRHELRGGKPRAALATLGQLQTQFPRGELAPERDVLMVEALSASGNTAAAKSRAGAFIAAHPSSPLSVKLERLVNAQ